MRATDRSRRPVATALTAATLLLAACSGEGGAGDESATEPSSQTLAEMVSDTDDLSVVAATLQDAGLAQIFDGVAAYTLLAPRDAVFESLGEAGATLRSAEQRPAMVAVLRDHIVPGYLTPDDIARAIAAEDDGKVAMKTMGGHTLTFAETGGTITATSEAGVMTRFAGDALLASNGVAIPVDGLVVDVSPAAEPQ